MSEPDSAQIERAVAGDMAALRALLERYGGQVAAEINAQIGRTWQSVVDAADVMQVSYIEAFLHIGTLTTREPAGFLAWLRRLAQNNLRDAVRDLERGKRPPPSRRVAEADPDASSMALIALLGVDSGTPSRAAAGAEARRMIEAALDKLPPDYGRVVRLYDLESQSIEAVAAAMQRSPGAIHMLRARAHDHLRTLLGSAENFLGQA